MTCRNIRSLLAIVALLLGCGLIAAPTAAQEDRERPRAEERATDAEDVRAQTRAREQEPIFGRDLMTPEEIRAHRDKMRSLQTPEARRAYREEHHRRMVERARERGVELPEEPPAAGGGRGSGPGVGGGKGRGAGSRGDGGS